MSICEHCDLRYSWYCDDGCAYPKHGCSEFVLDWYTLNEKQKKAIIRNLDEKEQRWYEEY